jgi:hypothetical protein
VTSRGEVTAASGWDRLAQAVAQIVPPDEVDAVWVFSPVRRDSREWGTAVLSRVEGDRRRIYTARYVLSVKGKERGKFESTILEVGIGPLEVLTRLSVPPESWFSAARPAEPRLDGTPG